MADRKLGTVGLGLVAMCRSQRSAQIAAETVHECRVIVGLALKGQPRESKVDAQLYELERKLWARASELEAKRKGAKRHAS